MANTSTIIGYVVKNNVTFQYVDFVEDNNPWDRKHRLVDKRPTPISQADAYRRLAGFIDERTDLTNFQNFSVVPVFYEPTPLEKASKELGGLLESLCSRHGLNLGLTREQMEKQIAKELQELGAGGSSFVATGIPRFGR